MMTIPLKVKMMPNYWNGKVVAVSVAVEVAAKGVESFINLGQGRQLLVIVIEKQRNEGPYVNQLKKSKFLVILGCGENQKNHDFFGVYKVTFCLKLLGLELKFFGGQIEKKFWEAKFSVFI